MSKKRKIIFLSSLLVAACTVILLNSLLKSAGEKAVEQFSSRIGGKIQTKEVIISIFKGIEFRKFHLKTDKGETLFRCRKINLRPEIKPLLFGKIRIKDIELNDAEAILSKNDGMWNFHTVAKRISENRENTFLSENLKVDINNALLRVNDGKRKYLFAKIYSRNLMEKSGKFKRIVLEIFGKSEVLSNEGKSTSDKIRIKISILLSGKRVKSSKGKISAENVLSPLAKSGKIKIDTFVSNAFSNSFSLKLKFQIQNFDFNEKNRKFALFRKNLNSLSKIFGREIVPAATITGSVKGRLKQKKDAAEFFCGIETNTFKGKVAFDFAFAKRESKVRLSFTSEGKEKNFKIYGNVDYPYSKPALSRPAKQALAGHIRIIYENLKKISEYLSTNP